MSEKISLIIPSKNEVESLGAVLEEVKNNEYVDEVIVIVDSEKDNSIDVTKKFNCKLIIQEKKGYGAAIIEGFKKAKNSYGCIYNADYSFDPKYLEGLINLSKNYDFVFGSRYIGSGGSDDDDIITFVGNKIFTCDVKKFNTLNLENDDFKFCIELPVKVKKNNFTYTDLEMFERKRYDGKKKVNVIKDGLLISFEIIRGFLLLYFK